MNIATSHLATHFDLSALSLATRLAINELLCEGESDNTLASRRTTLRYWDGWSALRCGTTIQLPVAPEVVLEFIVDHAQRLRHGELVHGLPPALDAALVESGFKAHPGPLALSTIIHHVAMLSAAHRVRELSNPCHDPRVKELLRKLRCAYAKRGAVPKRKDALTREPLQASLDTCDGSLSGMRDRAVLRLVHRWTAPQRGGHGRHALPERGR
jgi:hypothetical protein